MSIECARIIVTVAYSRNDHGVIGRHVTEMLKRNITNVVDRFKANLAPAYEARIHSITVEEASA